ncbi:MAG: bifunctional ornithine acetyltransferase/N-acetylglutamate synthase [Streptococcus sp.]
MKDIMHEDEVTITVDLHAGHEKGTAWGCDLSYDYVKINALYTLRLSKEKELTDDY